MTRPDWDSYFLAGAMWVASRADCTRSRVGAILVREHRIVSTGYNGSIAGTPGCLDGNCPRGRQSYVDRPSTADYSDCIALHAECNAILYARREDRLDATLYVTRPPCDACLRVIAASGVARVVYFDQAGYMQELCLAGRHAA